ncbi:hypothetical protein [Paraburkholderia fungorum]|uniref:Uncharacterized protein n=1 Tax=Paraburkholderia fungorum TaxID=134537 RepID=A0AAW3UYN2_9BURK|nr:hypothetical protein [Paraburkholderia fungorum]MBB4515834.1 hypothetical protein [Paraburkholderia fungorum]MBB6203750.1 hypothetical protein [Paraburkholderia fungorum]
MNASEYRRILVEDGRRVANRVAYASLGRGEETSLGDFYAMYSDERSLPENERCKTRAIADFDPVGWSCFYNNHPASKYSPIYLLTKGASAQWFAELKGARETWGDWVIDFIHKSLVRDESDEVFDAIADNQGEYVTRAYASRYCGWFPGWRGWIVWANSVTDSDIAVLRQMFEPQFTHRHPEPGSPEAEAFLEKHRKD